MYSTVISVYEQNNITQKHTVKLYMYANLTTYIINISYSIITFFKAFQSLYALISKKYYCILMDFLQ